MDPHLDLHQDEKSDLHPHQMKIRTRILIK
jgi:hypothetical protein